MLFILQLCCPVCQSAPSLVMFGVGSFSALSGYTLPLLPLLLQQSLLQLRAVLLSRVDDALFCQRSFLFLPFVHFLCCFVDFSPQLPLPLPPPPPLFRDKDVVGGNARDDLASFWLRKTKKPVLSVLLVQKKGGEPQLYRGTNMEVRPAGA